MWHKRISVFFGGKLWSLETMLNYVVCISALSENDADCEDDDDDDFDDGDDVRVTDLDDVSC